MVFCGILGYSMVFCGILGYSMVFWYFILFGNIQSYLCQENIYSMVFYGIFGYFGIVLEFATTAGFSARSSCIYTLTGAAEPHFLGLVLV